MTKPEWHVTAPTWPFVIRISSFFRHSSLGIRHWHAAGARKLAGRTKVLLCLPALVYLLLAAQWHQRGADRPGGDEPYYLLAAESLADDFDVDLKNNLRKHGSHPAGMNESHLILQPHGWFSVHNLGLPAFVSLPWAVGGPWGARLMMALGCGLAAPILYRTISRIWPSPAGALMMSLSLALAMPFLHASNQIYPDLLAGILLLFAADKALAAEPDAPTLRWRDLLLPAALALLPWLHVKYTGAAVVALAWYVHAGPRPRSFITGAALGASVALLACYNGYAFGKATGPYQPGALAVGINSAIVFLGLHFDQTQGMFFEQPLWLLGLIGLAPFWRHAPNSCLWWLLLYAAAIVPNALHPAWYGGHSFVGRFGATAVLLWAVPLAHASRELFGNSVRGPALLAALSIALQTYLARNWLTAGDGLFHQDGRPGLWEGCVWAYNSFYPPALKEYLPYWQPYVEFWRHPANLAVLVVAAGLLICGFFCERRRAAIGCTMATALLAAAVLSMPAKSYPAACAADEALGFVGRQEPGRRIAREALDDEGVMAKTPHLFPAPGYYRIVVDYEADGEGDHAGL
ncbi:MAG: hypothetical protein ACREHD_27790, partial [Pirellulales bacterium]